jgi:hypothetical protein
MRAGWPRGWSSSPGWEKLFLFQRRYTGSEAHPASYPMGTGGVLSPRVERPGREAPTGAEVKNKRIYTSTPPYVFMVYSLIN